MRWFHRGRRQLRPRRSLRSWPLTGNVVTGIIGVVMAGSGGYAASHWIVGLSGGSSAAGRAASISNGTVRPTACPAATDVICLGGNGDAVSPSPTPMPCSETVTAVQLPATTTSASGSSNRSLTTARAGGRPATPGAVTCDYSTGISEIPLRELAGGDHHS